MTDAGQRLAWLANEAVHHIQGQFAKYSGVSWRIAEVDVDRVTVRASHLGKWSIDSTAVYVRNALTAFFRDLLPCQILRFEHEEETVFLPFYSPAGFDTAGPVILIDSICDRWREEDRPKFEAAWSELWLEEGDIL